MYVDCTRKLWVLGELFGGRVVYQGDEKHFQQGVYDEDQNLIYYGSIPVCARGERLPARRGKFCNATAIS